MNSLQHIVEVNADVVPAVTALVIGWLITASFLAFLRYVLDWFGRR